MSMGWPPFRYRFSTTLQSGTVFYQKKVENGPTMEPKRLHSGAKTAAQWYRFLETVFSQT